MDAEQDPHAAMKRRLAAADQELRRRIELVNLQRALRDRLIVEAIDSDGMSQADVARVLGMTDSGVRKALVAA